MLYSLGALFSFFLFFWGVAAAEKENAAIRLMKQTVVLELKKFDDPAGFLGARTLQSSCGVKNTSETDS